MDQRQLKLQNALNPCKLTLCSSQSVTITLSQTSCEKRRHNLKNIIELKARFNKAV